MHTHNHTHTYTQTTVFSLECLPAGEWVSDVTGLSPGYLYSINSVLHCPDAICICSTPQIPVRQHKGLHNPACLVYLANNVSQCMELKFLFKHLNLSQKSSFYRQICIHGRCKELHNWEPQHRIRKWNTWLRQQRQGRRKRIVFFVHLFPLCRDISQLHSANKSRLTNETRWRSHVHCVSQITLQ